MRFPRLLWKLLEKLGPSLNQDSFWLAGQILGKQAEKLKGGFG